MAEQEWTLGTLLDWTAKHLAQKGIEHPRLDAEVLLAHAAGAKRIDLYGIRHAEPATPEIRNAYRDLIKKRLEGCPVAYLVGRKEFYGLDFQVGPSVLIPRPDSEHVVMECMNRAKGKTALKICDVGVGSGNLAVTLAKHLADAEVTAIDISGTALETAKANADKHGVGGRIRFLEGDLLSAIAVVERFDFIVSNPPYIVREEIAKLPGGVRDYEPHVALDGGANGFAVFDRLIEQARGHLTSGGFLIVEIGAPQEEVGRRKFSAFADYELMPTVKDFSGHPRVLIAKKRA